MNTRKAVWCSLFTAGAGMGLTALIANKAAQLCNPSNLIANLVNSTLSLNGFTAGFDLGGGSTTVPIDSITIGESFRDTDTYNNLQSGSNKLSNSCKYATWGIGIPMVIMAAGLTALVFDKFYTHDTSETELDQDPKKEPLLDGQQDLETGNSYRFASRL